jgi:hypothetical protein
MSATPPSPRTPREYGPATRPARWPPDATTPSEPSGQPERRTSRPASAQRPRSSSPPRTPRPQVITNGASRDYAQALLPCPIERAGHHGEPRSRTGTRNNECPHRSRWSGALNGFQERRGFMTRTLVTCTDSSISRDHDRVGPRMARSPLRTVGPEAGSRRWSRQSRSDQPDDSACR